jgi:hypothetical protein
VLEPADRQVLRALLDKAGGPEELCLEVCRAAYLPKRGRGRPPALSTSEFLAFFELVCRIFERIGIPRKTTLRMLACQSSSNLGSKTANAAVERIASKLRDPEFQKRFDDILCDAAKTFPNEFTALKRAYDGNTGSSQPSTSMRSGEDNRREWAATFKKIIAQSKR